MRGVLIITTSPLIFALFTARPPRWFYVFVNAYLMVKTNVDTSDCGLILTVNCAANVLKFIGALKCYRVSNDLFNETNSELVRRKENKTPID